MTSAEELIYEKSQILLFKQDLRLSNMHTCVCVFPLPA